MVRIRLGELHGRQWLRGFSLLERDLLTWVYSRPAALSVLTAVVINIGAQDRHRQLWASLEAVQAGMDPSQGERDIYGRLLAYVWPPDGRNFGEVMIADGFAHEHTYNLPYAHVDAFNAAQALAIMNQAGLWSPATCAGDTTRPADPPASAQPQPLTPVPAPNPAPALKPVVPP
jgi:hypothetical protein